MPPQNRDGWEDYSRLVLAELERHNRLLEDLNREVALIRKEMASREELTSLQGTVTQHQINVGGQLAALQIKAGMWGATAGGLLAVFPVLVQLLTRK